MSEKKKPPLLAILKRFNSVRGNDISPPETPSHHQKHPVTIRNTESPPETPSHQPSESDLYKLKAAAGAKKYQGSISKGKGLRRGSTSGINQLIQCSLCLEILHNPKMLPCQHTFCQACLKVYVADLPIIDCPICNTRIQITGSNFLDNLPSNLYIDSLLEIVGVSAPNKQKKDSSPTLSLSGTISKAKSVELHAGGVRCAHCQTMSDFIDVTACQHCKSSFCGVCWSQHLEDMRSQIGSILKQLDTASNRLDYKIEHFKDRCDHITEQINKTADEKISAILESKENVLQEASEFEKTGTMTALALKTSLSEAKIVATATMEDKGGTDDKEQVDKFMNLHQNAIQILSDISKWGTDTFVFDRDNFRFEMDSATPIDAESDDPLPDPVKESNPMENEETLAKHYRARSFVPHFVWRKSVRPCGVGVSPWSDNLYICGVDTHNVLIVEKSKATTIAKLVSDEMLCPVHIAFMKSLGEIYVTDKWKHCIHVFSRDGDYLRAVGQKGSRLGMFRSPEGIATDNAHRLIYVADTGNDRIQVIQPNGTTVSQLGISRRPQVVMGSNWTQQEILCTEFNAPAGIALTKDRIIVLDAGNRRVKVYDKENKSKIAEFGSFGSGKGQFRQPEAIAVDPMGYILVGDSGNCRVQVFKQNGQLVRVFGGLGTTAGKFGWISGIYVTKQLDIIVSDPKNYCVNFF